MKKIETNLPGVAYIDFNDFAEAEDFAEENNGCVCLFKKYEDDNKWISLGEVFEPLWINEREFGPDCTFYHDAEEWSEFCEEIIEMLKEDGVPANDIDKSREELDNITKLFDKMSDDEVIATFGKTGDAIRVKVGNLMLYCADDYCKAVGVLIPSDDESGDYDE